MFAFLKDKRLSDAISDEGNEKDRGGIFDKGLDRNGKYSTATERGNTHLFFWISLHSTLGNDSNANSVSFIVPPYPCLHLGKLHQWTTLWDELGTSWPEPKHFCLLKAACGMSQPFLHPRLHRG